MTGPRRIGILGGMGPQATVLLMQKLIDGVEARDDSDHIPLYVDSNTQVPSRIAALIEGAAADPGPVLEAMARRLETIGAEALAMPCNTAHHYAERIAAAVSIPFLDMVVLSARAAAAAQPSGGKVGVLGSPALRRVGTLARALKAEGLEALHPSDEEAMLTTIRAIKRGDKGPEGRATLRSASAELAAQGARVQLVACSELSLIADTIAGGVRVIDTIDVLAQAVIDFAGVAAKRTDSLAS